MQVGTIEVDGQEYPVELLVSRKFSCRVAGHECVAARWDELVPIVRKEARKLTAKVAVRFAAENGRLGTATGFHARTDDVLVRWDDGERDNGNSVYAPLRPDVDREELARLMRASREAEAALEKFREANRLGRSPLRILVRQAIDDAVRERIALSSLD